MVARKGDTPKYVRNKQQDLFEVLAKARSHKELRKVKKSAAKEVRKRCIQQIEGADARELTVHPASRTSSLQFTIFVTIDFSQVLHRHRSFSV